MSVRLAQSAKALDPRDSTEFPRATLLKSHPEKAADPIVKVELGIKTFFKLV